ncbi:extracellular solute-binding protein [Candidatus Sumerlaeota bacterium]|nr:extracellular solute-binding protein [Candidatus Sumerlaeota bacterium]
MELIKRNGMAVLSLALLVGVALNFIQCGDGDEARAVVMQEAKTAAKPAVKSEAKPEAKNEVVVYTAHDRLYSEPVLKKFEEQTGMRALSKFDTEATKTIGLVEALKAEKNRPRCDVWWNNEIMNTIRLKRDGVLEPLNLEDAPMPASFRDPDGYWYGFGARARILIVNTDLVGEDEIPSSIYDLANPKWKGQTGIAKPLFGTTVTHAAVLFAALGEEEAVKFFDSLKANDIVIEASNGAVAREVAAGRLAFGLTDTDDAVVQTHLGAPVKIVFPDQGEGRMGALLIPNTVARVKGGPNGDKAVALARYLISPEVETMLAESQAAQIPLNPDVGMLPKDLPELKDVRFMEADFEAAADAHARAQAYVEQTFLQ